MPNLTFKSWVQLNNMSLVRHLKPPQHLFCRCLFHKLHEILRNIRLRSVSRHSRAFCARESRVVALEVVTLMDTRTPTVRENPKWSIKVTSFSALSTDLWLERSTWSYWGFNKSTSGFMWLHNSLRAGTSLHFNNWASFGASADPFELILQPSTVHHFINLRNSTPRHGE